jgi:hypothetical protein
MITLPEPCLRAAGELAHRTGADARQGDTLTITPRPGGHTMEIEFKTKPVRIVQFVPSEEVETC